MGNNADTVKGVYDAFGKGDVPAVLGAMADKIDWQEPAGLPYDNQTTPQGIAENVFARVVTEIENFAVTVDEVFEAGDVVSAVGVYTGKGAATGVELRADFVHVWRFDADGKVNGFRTYTDTHLWREALGV